MESRPRPTVVIVGAGASGTLAALHLVRTARLRSIALDILLVDPAEHRGRGVAFGTPDDRHLLNVPAAAMSALPEDGGHFLRWLRQDQQSGAATNVFVARRQFAHYLDSTLTSEQRAAGPLVRLRQRRAEASGLERSADRWSVTTREGAGHLADAVVIATGLPQVGSSWACPALRESPCFVRNPWAPGALEAVRRDGNGPSDVLLVGTGLTMVDVVLSLSGRGNRQDRRLYAVSRNARLPRAHVAEASSPIIPDISDWGDDLDTLVGRITRHIEEVHVQSGDWRPAVDGLRIQLAELWGRLDESDRLRFLSNYAGQWNVLRHRMPPSSAESLRSLDARGELVLQRAEVLDAVPLPRGGLAVTLSDSSVRRVGWVVNCTGPQLDIRGLGNPLLNDLLRPRAGGALATVATAGMGFRTQSGRLTDASGSARAPLWTLGALRRGELWESTAVPEIRVQASDVATAVLDTLSAASTSFRGAPGVRLSQTASEPSTEGKEAPVRSTSRGAHLDRV